MKWSQFIEWLTYIYDLIWIINFQNLLIIRFWIYVSIARHFFQKNQLLSRDHGSLTWPSEDWGGLRRPFLFERLRRTWVYRRVLSCIDRSLILIHIHIHRRTDQFTTRRHCSLQLIASLFTSIFSLLLRENLDSFFSHRVQKNQIFFFRCVLERKSSHLVSHSSRVFEKSSWYDWLWELLSPRFSFVSCSEETVHLCSECHLSAFFVSSSNRNFRKHHLSVKITRARNSRLLKTRSKASTTRSRTNETSLSFSSLKPERISIFRLLIE